MLVLSLVPGSMRPSTGEGHHLEHFVAYMLVGISFALAVRTTGMRVSSLVLLAATSGALELLQHLVPGRTPEFAGFLFSYLGAAMGILVTTVVLAVIKKSTRV